MSWINAAATGALPAQGLDGSTMLPGFDGGGLGRAFAPNSAVARFDEAMHAASAPAPVQFAQVQQANSVTDAVPLTAVPGAGRPIEATSATERAVRGLELTDEGPGQSILDGLGRLRSIFDTQTNAVADITTGQVLDATTLMSLQAEVVRYTVLVDVSSKLAGKSTQALDALMKGQ